MTRGRSLQLVVLLLLAGCTTTPLPTPRLFETPQPSADGTSPSPTLPPDSDPAATPLVTSALSHFVGDGFAFDYPATWGVITPGANAGVDWTIAVVGTGEWADGCETSQCGAAVFTLDPGEVGVQLSFQFSGPAMPAFEVPPHDLGLFDSGLAAGVVDSPMGTTATVYVPGHRALTVDARWGSTPTDGDRAIVGELVTSLAYHGDRTSIGLEVWREPSAQRCAKETFSGRLARGHFGLVLEASSGDFRFLRWPTGWSSKLESDGRVDIQDADGVVVAREWDELEVGVRMHGDSEARVCSDSVRVTRAFGSS